MKGQMNRLKEAHGFLRRGDGLDEAGRHGLKVSERSRRVGRHGGLR